jgi:hypothetical protein
MKARMPNRPTRYKQPVGTTETVQTGVTLAMADARKPRGWSAASDGL